MGRLRWGPREGLVQRWRNWGPGLGCQAGFGEAGETRETGKGREPEHRLAGDPSGKPGNHSIGNSKEPRLSSEMS
jgi:hypothetical protein